MNEYEKVLVSQHQLPVVKWAANVRITSEVDPVTAVTVLLGRLKAIGDGQQQVTATARVQIPNPTLANLLRWWLWRDLGGAHIRLLRWLGDQLEVDMIDYESSRTESYSVRVCPHVELPNQLTHLQWVEMKADDEQ